MILILPIDKNTIIEPLLRASSPVRFPRTVLRELIQRRDVRDELIALALGKAAPERIVRKAARLLEALL